MNADGTSVNYETLKVKGSFLDYRQQVKQLKFVEMD